MTLVDMFKLNFLFVTVFLSGKFDFFAFLNSCICVVRLDENVY